MEHIVDAFGESDEEGDLIIGDAADEIASVLFHREEELP
eukprot:CAMPEP_0197300860 /NCGR_PEP_ID=MMETSP0890-20130614/49360_1 /TAXON_ID=44058 ORGANISM="Aureoumbra lagunensis, Strain CCMP1510" /NCGR_SAMPLE_ID=MMETSP0890 /ASSEMBLY_ACC=CAM_ASM_000533 /LENGTH=38 /DNA_ID= /DNA_START= /DNA_END= /DNA_ORIENTATION=